MSFHVGNEHLRDAENEGTGAHEKPVDSEVIFYPFGRYEIGVELTPTNEFIGIVEVRINKEFLSYKQKMASRGFHDVDEFYPE